MEAWKYIEKYWMEKLDMWITEERHVGHVVQDTNGAIELYHGTMKANLKSTKGCLFGCWMDWLIHKLMHNMITTYAYNIYTKECRFVSNKKAGHIVINSLLQAKKIQDICL